MGEALQPGERVRVAQGNRLSGFTRGETGRVLWALRWESEGGEVLFYLCEMDRTGATHTAAFLADEVEWDG